MNLSSFYNTLITNFSAADRIFDILDQKPIVKNSQAAKSIGKINGTVEFRDVSFAYDNDNEVLKNINFKVSMISIFIGVVLFFAKIHLPEIINNTLGSVGSMIGPASMIVTGMLFAGMNLKQIFADKRVYFVSFLRLIAVPLLALVMIKISHLAMFSADGNKITLIVFLAIITPSASTITQMCQVYGNDSRYASAINVMTTLFSIITMPLMVMLFEAVI